MAIFKKPGVIFAVLAAVLGLSLFVVGPFVSVHYGDGPANILFVGLRLVSVFFLGFALARFGGKGRLRVMTSAGALVFVDQVVFKGLYMMGEMRAHPADWPSLTPGTIVFNLVMGYMVFLPVMLFFAFAGSELGRRQT